MKPPPNPFTRPLRTNAHDALDKSRAVRTPFSFSVPLVRDLLAMILSST